MTQPHPDVTAALNEYGLEHRVIVHHEPVTSLAEAATARGVDIIDVVKSLVVRRGDDDYVIALVPGGRSLSWPKLRSVLGVSRMSMPPADEAFQATGFRRGTITPIGTSRLWPVIADERLANRIEITLGSGTHDVAIGVAPLLLFDAINATVADISEPEER
jgi:Cys-tRNA(Pro) deacylase